MTKETVSIRIDPQVWKTAKVYAAQHDMKMGELVENIIRETISKKRP